MIRVMVPRIVRCVPLELASYLVGEWLLEREIRDVRAGQLLRFTGDASVTWLGQDTLDYEEHGEIDTGDATLETRRSYRYVLLGGPRALVTFEDGAPFHELDLTTGADRAVHDCGEDVYRGLILTESDTWWTRWRVAGPVKDYIATTRAERVPSAPAAGAS